MAQATAPLLDSTSIRRKQPHRQNIIARRRHVAHLLYEGAQSVMKRSVKWSWLKAWAMNIAKRRGIKKSIIALARRMAVIMHRLWIDGTTFQWTKEALSTSP